MINESIADLVEAVELTVMRNSKQLRRAETRSDTIPTSYGTSRYHWSRGRSDLLTFINAAASCHSFDSILPFR